MDNHRGAVVQVSLVAVTGIHISVVCMNLADVGAARILTVGIHTARTRRIGMIGVHPRQVAVAAAGHRDHPAHGGILLKVVPGVSDLVVLNDGAHLGSYVRAGKLSTAAGVLAVGSLGNLQRLISGTVHVPILGDVPGPFDIRPLGRSKSSPGENQPHKER